MRRDALALPLIKQTLPQHEQEVFISALHKKALGECMQPVAIVSTFVVGGVAGSAAMLFIGPIALFLIPIGLLLQTVGVVRNSLGLFVTTQTIIPMRIGQVVGGVVAMPLSLVIGGVGTALRIWWLRHNRHFMYGDKILKIVRDAIENLSTLQQHNIITTLCHTIIACYGSARFATAESKALLASLSSEIIDTADKAQAINDYLSVRESLEIINPTTLESLAWCNETVLRNQGKRLFNTIISSALSDTDVVPEKYNTRTRRDAGFTIIIILLTTSGRMGCDAAFHIVNFLYQNPSLQQQAFSTLKLIKLQREYKKRVGFFDLDRSKKIFKPGESYDMALLRLQEDAGDNTGKPSYKTLKLFTSAHA